MPSDSTRISCEQPHNGYTPLALMLKDVRKTETEADDDAKTPLSTGAAVAPISKIFIDDLTERQRIWRIPWFLLNMCFIQISLYVIADDCFYQRLMFTPEHRCDELWRYFTYTLLHSDAVHLLLNLCLQCLIGFCLESEQGHWKLAFVYGVGGVSGSLATALIQPQLSMLGASAAIYATLTSHVPHLIKNFSALPHRYLRIVALLILCLSDVAFTSFHFLVNGNANPRICLVAHVAGGISGLASGALIYTSVRCGRGAPGAFACGLDCGRRRSSSSGGGTKPIVDI